MCISYWVFEFPLVFEIRVEIIRLGNNWLLSVDLGRNTIFKFCSPITLHRSSEAPNSGEQAECCICLGVFEDGDKVKVLPLCRHYYHSECVDRWLSGHSSCPLCRASVLVDTPVGLAIPQIVVE